jgi:hypothetical protein
MKPKIMVIAGTALALAITAMEPVHAKGCECTGQDVSPEPLNPIHLAAGCREDTDEVAEAQENFCAGGKRLCFIDECVNKLTWHCRCAP